MLATFVSGTVTAHGSPPMIGEDVRYVRRADGHDCLVGDELRLTVRSGHTEPRAARGRSSAARFSAEQVAAFADGRPFDCFGTGWELTRAHVRSPRIEPLLDEVTCFDTGYLRAMSTTTRLFDGAVQALAFYLAARGRTVDRDGWRFELVPGRPVEAAVSQVPDGAGLTYEVFVTGEGQHEVTADVVCTVDGSVVGHANGMSVHLVSDWPLEHWCLLGPPAVLTSGEQVPLHKLGGLRGYDTSHECLTHDGVRFDYAAMLASAWGRQSVLGEKFAVFDSARRAPRLPGPPYHFVTRAVDFGDGPSLVAEYDVPDEAWYFEQNSRPVMPWAVLMEVMLQPCGALASIATDLHTTEQDLFFRNLDGTATVFGEVTPRTRVLRTRTKLRSSSSFGEAIIVSFDIECWADGVPIAEISAVFGYFTKAALAKQIGLPTTTDDDRALTAPSEHTIDLAALRVAGPMLLMLDQITGYWPHGGAAGLGRLRAEKDIDAGEWYFKAHFFQDPVQPGSLGIEAMVQLLQVYLVTRNGLVDPLFEPVMTGHEVSWTYRGQILPTNATMTIEMEITSAGTGFAIADAWLWIDGLRIYQARGLGVRAVSPSVPEAVLDTAEQDWLLDHRVAWVLPAMPMMSTADHMAAAATAHTGLDVTGLSGVRLLRWFPVAGPTRVRTEVEPAPGGATVTVSCWRDAATAELSRFEQVAIGFVHLGSMRSRPPESLPPLVDAQCCP